MHQAPRAALMALAGQRGIRKTEPNIQQVKLPYQGICVMKGIDGEGPCQIRDNHMNPGSKV